MKHILILLAFVGLAGCDKESKPIDYSGYWMPVQIDKKTDTVIIPKKHMTEFKKSPIQDCEKFRTPKFDFDKWKECTQKRIDALEANIRNKDMK